MCVHFMYQRFGGGSRSAAAGGSENDGATGSSGKADDKDKKETKKEEPNFELSGKLTAETNTYKVHIHVLHTLCILCM